MKRLLFVVFLFVNTEVIARHPDSVPHRKDSLRKTVDTSNKKLQAPTHSNYFLAIDKTGYPTDDIKVVVSKDEGSSDFWKYVFPIITLLLGILVNRSLDFFSDRKKVTKTGKRWIAELISLKLPIESQIESLNKLQAEHAVEKFAIPEIELTTSLDGEVFKSLDRGEFVQYIQRVKDVDFNSAVISAGNVNAYISVLTDHRTSFLKKIDEYMDDLSAATTSFSMHLQDSLRNLGELQVTIEIESHTDAINNPVFANISKLYEDQIFPYMKNGNYDVFELEQKFMIPLAAIHMMNRHDHRLKPIGEALSGMFSDLKKIRMVRRYMDENVATIIARYQKSLNELQPLISSVQKEG